MKNRVHLLLMIVWMLFIFIMSAQTGNQSSETSGMVMTLLAKLGVPMETKIGGALHFIIRKGAHFFEYFVLSLLCYNYVRGFMKGKAVYTWPIIVSFLYACSDEFHQTFVPGRVGAWTDVLIDTLGAIVAMVTVYFYHIWKQKLEHPNNQFQRNE